MRTALVTFKLWREKHPSPTIWRVLILGYDLRDPVHGWQRPKVRWHGGNGCSTHSRQQASGQKMEGPEWIYPSWLQIQQSLYSYCNNTFSHEGISGLVYWYVQWPQEPITFKSPTSEHMRLFQYTLDKNVTGFKF